ncbi:hypothetical protein G4Y79_11495 [Phototrophicus methaneseepsis]|uniref:Uncharacterized protein n=1 Tax=Phototrophicus methaneseepsis TaxID=2710758 RepID=A0A7S8IFQ1_9CHLR|nr:hypothetical protein [Phototrophicus methaneseepsis]QPC84960.1 hypothetical protein G4Y79_11495 [Phototrophicus methaneseepsis]
MTKHHRKYILLTAVLLGIAFRLVYAFSETGKITLEGPITLTAGEAWALNITIDNGSVGDTLEASIINGLQVLHETLTLGTGSIALWHIPEGTITQAGESLLIITYGNDTVEQNLAVLPAEPAQVDLFSTMNSLPSYGEGETTVMILPRDLWGNAPPNDSHFSLHVQYPTGESLMYPFEYREGLGYLQLVSQGGPGRLRLSIAQDQLAASLELVQTSGVPSKVELELVPDCVLNDGRDMVTLEATILDSNAYNVVDGTLVTFTWDDGQGYGRTIDGTAMLRLPAPLQTGHFVYGASSGQAHAEPAMLEVTAERCDVAQ